MLIKLIANVYGAWTGKPGDVRNRPDMEATKLIAGGFAVPVKESEVTERATVNEPLETR